MLVRRDELKNSADLVVASDYIASCSDSLVPDPKENPGLVQDCKTLLSIRDGLGAGNGFLNWSPNVPMTEWRGVTVAVTLPRVIGLEVYSGTRIARVYPQIGSLDALLTLVLAGQKFVGNFPVELGKLTSLQRLEIINTSLTGPVPPEITALDSLRILHLDTDNLGVPVHPELTGLENLRELVLVEDGEWRCTPAQFAAIQRSKYESGSHPNARTFTEC